MKFDPWRSSGLPDLGSVACDSVKAPGGIPVVDRWYADLPDDGFLFPGDVLHYYFSATDNLAGDLQTATLPADTAGFSDFGDYARWSAFDRRFVVRALPTIDWPGASTASWHQPNRLLWFDGADEAAWDRWQLILNQLCLWPGVNADIYTTRAAAAMAGNGLGAAATPAQIAEYEGILYTSGSLAGEVLGDGDEVNEASPDLQLLAAWLDQGDKGLVLGGDNLAGGLMEAVGGEAFLHDRLGAHHLYSDVRQYINNQVTPRVLVMGGDPVFQWIPSWQLDGGCPSIAAFDGIVTATTGVRSAEFANPGGSGGSYDYAAAVRNTANFSGSRTLLLPFAPSRVVADPLGGSVPGGRLAATVVVHDALQWTSGFNLPFECWSGVEDEVPAARFTASAYPNPFNPRVRIDYTVARAGRLTVKIFDLRGRLVRTLLDEQVSTGGRVDWDGTDRERRRVRLGRLLLRGADGQ